MQTTKEWEQCQVFCSKLDCQRVRKTLWQKQKLATDPEYKADQLLTQKKWLQDNRIFCFRPPIILKPFHLVVNESSKEN